MEGNMRKKNYILGKEAAKDQLEIILDRYDLDLDSIDDKDLKKALKNSENRLIEAFRLGRLEVKSDNDDFKVIQILKNGKRLEYREIDGVAKTQMAGKDVNDMYGKTYSLMGSLCGQGEAVIKNLKGVDLALSEVLGLVFLSV